MNIRAAIASFALILAGCTQPLDTRIDGSSQGAYEKRLKAIKAKLTPEEIAEGKRRVADRLKAREARK